jgi:hypothetical protein
VSVATLEAVDREEFLAALERLERQGVEGILVNHGPVPGVLRAVHGAGREVLRLLLCAINAPAEPPHASR